jgi:hypothetical protein
VRAAVRRAHRPLLPDTRDRRLGAGTLRKLWEIAQFFDLLQKKRLADAEQVT